MLLKLAETEAAGRNTKKLEAELKAMDENL